MLKQILLLTVFVLSISARNYPLYKQCDPTWAHDRLGTSADTICTAGCLMSSVAMALTGTGRSYNPRTLNQWLTNNGGYVNGDGYVWSSANHLGLTWKGFLGKAYIKSNIDFGNIVILNVHNGHHWVLATGYSGDNFHVNDPGFQVTSYPIDQVGTVGCYGANAASYYLYQAEVFVNWVLGKEKEIEYAPAAIMDFSALSQE